MKLFEPITIRDMSLKNRIVMSSMGLALGFTNKRMKDFYIERARGGVGAISIGAGIPELFASDDIWGKPGAVNIFIERLKGVTDEIRSAGAKIGVQFYYGNRFPFSMDPNAGGEMVAPSARVEPEPARSAWVASGDSLREITIEEIEYIIDTFGKAAAAAKEAGFDFVEIHNAHGLLPCQFFSPITNHRTDKYGGDLRGRMRFSIECVQAMRSAVGDNYPLFARFGAMDAVPNGFDINEGVAFAVEMEKAGVDVFNVSLGMPPFQGGYVPAGEDPTGTHVHLAETIKRNVSVPVIAVGRIKTPQFAESILSQGKADLVALGRQLIVDPLWPQKAAAGKDSDIVPCIDCHKCYERIIGNNVVECTVNYCAGREREAAIKTADKPKKVLIVGGGPAGMEAARVAAMRGHKVTLQEKSNQLGGALLLQATIPYKDQVENLTEYLIVQINRAGVKIELGKEVTPESVKKDNPDVVIIATGANSITLDIPGINRENVISSSDIRKIISGGFKKDETAIRSGYRGALIRLGGTFLNRSLSLSMRKRFAEVGIPVIFGKRVAILGSDLTACQLADLLAENGRTVTIIAKEEQLADDLVSTLRIRLLRRLAQRGVSMITGIKDYKEITNSGLAFINSQGDSQAVDAETIIPMVGLAPDDGLVKELKNAASEVYVVGDCAEPIKLLHAIHDGARIGRTVM